MHPLSGVTCLNEMPLQHTRKAPKTQVALQEALARIQPMLDESLKRETAFHKAWMAKHRHEYFWDSNGIPIARR
mgnify:CR=1 FL=1